MNWIQVGFECFLHLGSVFLETVSRRSNHASFAASDSGAALCNGSDFYLGWRQSSPSDSHSLCMGTDWVVFLFQFLTCHAVSWWTRWLLLEPFARWHMGPKRATNKRIEKFSQTLVAATSHILSGYFAYTILRDKEWVWDADQWAKDIDQSIEPDFKFYYLLYAARYVSDLISLWYEHKRSDTFAYAIHHAATIPLVLGSAATGYFRMGGVLMFVLDWADPPMLLAKAFKYASRDPSDMYQFCADRLFELFAVAFVLTRNVLFPYIAWHAIVGFENNAQTLVLKFFLVVLILLMKYWLILIILIAMKHFRDNHAEDIRSDDESVAEADQQRIARKKKDT